jgi:hypothetical protein
VRKIFGYERYDSQQALEAMNDLYRNELRILQNLFLPSMKLVEKTRIGSKLKRRYDQPHTPLDRLLDCPQADPLKIQKLKDLRETIDPFALAQRIEQKLERIFLMANRRISPNPLLQPSSKPLTRAERQALQEISEFLATMRHAKKKKLPLAGLHPK